MTVITSLTPDRARLLRRVLEALEDHPKLGAAFRALELSEEERAQAHGVLAAAGALEGLVARTRPMTEPEDGFRWWALEPTPIGREWLEGPEGREL